MQPRVRAYRDGDSAATAALLYESAGGMYDRYAGTRHRAERALARALDREGTTVSAEVVRVAELAGQVSGAMAAMPFDQWAPRAQALLKVILRSVPPWRWPGALWLHGVSGRAAPDLPTRSLYVDSLATAPGSRRRGVAQALLDDAERQAREQRLDSVALDTWIDNHGARALYLSAGFVEVAHTPPARGLPGGVSLLKELG